jgi:lambda family phage tail tape measure protein
VEAIEAARRRAAETVTEFGRTAGDRLAEQQQQAELAGLSGIRRSLREIEIQENSVATAARRRVEEQLGESDPARLAAALQEIDRISQEITSRRSAAAQAISDEQRTFSAGWARAFAEYEDAATDSSQQAERIFRETTQGMEDAIVGFAKTGKFEWRDFTASILEELLRSNLRQLISSTFGAALPPSGGGGMSTAQAAAFMGTTPRGAAPEPAGGGIASVLKTVGNLFAGFFATGGTIPPGRFGVVGERGPELVTGPATVTPMSGATQVTYNINAVDAQSFQQLLARDPALLFNLTEQGRRNFAGAR